MTSNPMPNSLPMKITDDAKTKTSKLMQNLKKKFDVYSYWNDKELDENFPAPKKPTTREFSETQESNDFKGKYWNEMDKSEMMTFREYLLFFKAYHEKTGKYPDVDGWTIFKDSLSDGYVAYGGWAPDSRQVKFDWNCPGFRNSRSGARVAISLNPSATLVPSALPETLTINGVVYKKHSL